MVCMEKLKSGELMFSFFYEILEVFIELGWVLMLVSIMPLWYSWIISCEVPWKAIYS